MLQREKIERCITELVPPLARVSIEKKLNSIKADDSIKVKADAAGFSRCGSEDLKCDGDAVLAPPIKKKMHKK